MMVACPKLGYVNGICSEKLYSVILCRAFLNLFTLSFWALLMRATFLFQVPVRGWWAFFLNAAGGVMKTVVSLDRDVPITTKQQ